MTRRAEGTRELRTLVLVRIANADAAESARRDLENVDVSVDAYTYDPATKCMTITTPTPHDVCQRSAMAMGYRPLYVTFRGSMA